MPVWLFIVAGLAGVTSGLWWLTGEGSGQPAPLDAEERACWRLVIPREGRFGVAEATAWFSSLAAVLPLNRAPLIAELRAQDRELAFHLSAPADWERLLRGQLAAWFPGARLERAAETVPPGFVMAQPLRLARPDLYPLRVPSPRDPDPLLGLLGALTQADHAGGLRIAMAAAPPDWHPWAPAALDAARQGRRLPPRGGWLRLYRGYQVLRQATTLPERRSRPAPSAVAALAGAEAKVRAPVYAATIIVWAAGHGRAEAEGRVISLAALLQSAYHDPEGNTLLADGPPQRWEPGSGSCSPSGPQVVLSAGELAGLFHLPAPGHPLLPGEPSRRVAPAPALLPANELNGVITHLGEALTPAGPVPLGLGLDERRLHAYVTGKTGTGKSTLLATIIRQDLEAGRGVAVLDPHGDLAERVLTFVPPDRADEVIYFNPADTDFPIGLNLLAATSPSERPLVASGVIAVFKKLFAEFWGPRLEHTFRQALLALLETPTPTLLLLPRLLTDRSFREHVLTFVRDPLLLAFFHEEYERYDPRWRAEAISPILNKVGQFLATPTLRHVVGPASPGLNLRQVMDGGGIFIANLATGRIGEDAAALLGGLLVAGFQLAAMARAGQPEEHRRDFFLTVDEFQHFANDAFAVLLSEARKFHVGLTLSHQYLSQVPPGLAEAVLGNVGTLAVFRVGAPDAARLVKELAPAFDLQDLVHLPNYRFCTRLTRAGETLPAFSARTVPLPPPARDPGALIERSRQRWAHPRAAVELEIADLWEGRVD